MIDMATVGTGGGSVAWIDQHGFLKVGPTSAGADPGPISYGRGGTEPTVTDAALVLGRLPGALIGGELRLRADLALAAFAELGSRLGLSAEEAAAGVLEIAAANQVHGIRRVTVHKGIDPSTCCLVAFGGAGGMLAADVADFLGSPTILSPPNPGNLSAFGLQVSDIRRDHVRTFVRRQHTAETTEIVAAWSDLVAAGREEMAVEGVAASEVSTVLAADMRYSGQSYEVRVLFNPSSAIAAACDEMWDLFHRAHDREFGYSYAGQQEVELVNLRVQAVGHIYRPPVDLGEALGPSREPDGDEERTTTRPTYWRRKGWVDCAVVERSGISPGSVLPGPVVIEEYGSTIVVPDGWSARLRRIVQPPSRQGTAVTTGAAGRTLSPIDFEVIEGTIRSTEVEIEAAVERTARSPMIRDQHDYRVALFDARGRKLTGRSYSAVVDPIFERFGLDNVFPGDVFFWNDPYNSSGGVGHIPDLCTTVPIFAGDRLIGFSQVFGHHDDVGGMVPGSLPVHAVDMWQEGLVVPPIKLFERGRRSEAFEVIARNSRLSDHLRGDLDAESGAALIGVRRVVDLAERFGPEVLEQAFDQMLAKCARILRDELLPKIADGTYHWEDFIECDGVKPPRLHALRMTMKKTSDKIVLDFTGTDPEADGPINWAINYSDGRFVRKWLAPVLRSLADSPQRAAEIDINEGALEVLEVVFPAPGTLVTPNFGKPTGLRFFILLRSLGVFAALLAKATDGRMPADHETIRIWGLYGQDREGSFFLFREVLGGGGPGRPWADGSDVVHVVPNSRNLPAEFSEMHYPVMVERLGLRTDSGGAGLRRGGLGYEKVIRPLVDCRLLSNADRSLVNPYGTNGGRCGGNYSVSLARAGGPPEELPGMCDDVEVATGDRVTIVTTGGGGWGDPLQREPGLVAYDVTCGLVSPEGAARDYGVVVTEHDGTIVIDDEATAALRSGMRADRPGLAMFDRGAYVERARREGGYSAPEGWADPDEGWLAVTDWGESR